MMSQEKELLLQLLEDVAMMETKEDTPFPSSDQLRNNFAPSLRRWIVEGMFFQVQKILGAKINFSFYSHVDGVRACEVGCYKNWLGLINAGGGIIISPCHLSEKHQNRHDQIPPQRKAFKIEEKAQRFFEQPCCLWEGQMYKRKDFLIFLANKLGGVHYEMDRNRSEKHIDDIRNFFAVRHNLKARQIEIVPPGEIPNLRADAEARPFLYDAVQMVVGDTGKIFCQGIRKVQSKIEAVL
jgi:hypothetical protein